jgi:hypothetical protein
MPERLTDRVIAAFRHPGGANSVYLYDSEVVGLAIRIYPGGAKSFTFDWSEDGRARRVTIGRAPAWTIGAARRHAGALRLKADTGESIAPGRGSRVADLVQQWRGVVALTRRPGTVRSYGRLLDRRIIPHFGKLEPNRGPRVRAAGRT